MLKRRSHFQALRTVLTQKDYLSSANPRMFPRYAPEMAFLSLVAGAQYSFLLAPWVLPQEVASE